MKYRSAGSSLFWTLAMLALLGCQKGCEQLTRTLERQVAQAVSDEVKAPALAPVTEEEASAFGEAMLAGIESGDGEAIQRLIDFPTMLTRSLAGLKLPMKQVTETAQGVATGARKSGFIAQLATMQQANTTSTLLPGRLDRAGRWVSVRTLPESGGVEHYDFLLTKRADGSVAAADVFFLSAGEEMSASLRRLLIGAFALDKTFVESLGAEDSLFVKHLEDLNRIRSAQMAGRHEEALSIFDAMPEELRVQKFALLIRMQSLGQNADDPRYAECIGTLVERYPDDPAATFAAIDYYFLKKEYAKSLEAVNAVEKAAGGDPYFGVLKSNVLADMGRLDEAKQVALATIEREPDLLPAHLSLVNALVRQKDHAGAARQLVVVRRQFAWVPTFENVPEYAAFVASPEYGKLQREWAKD
jgi:tetratricopeptide (TPR) repeat protein